MCLCVGTAMMCIVILCVCVYVRVVLLWGSCVWSHVDVCGCVSGGAECICDQCAGVCTCDHRRICVCRYTAKEYMWRSEDDFRSLFSLLPGFLGLNSWHQLGAQHVCSLRCLTGLTAIAFVITATKRARTAATPEHSYTFLWCLCNATSCSQATINLISVITYTLEFAMNGFILCMYFSAFFILEPLCWDYVVTCISWPLIFTFDSSPLYWFTTHCLSIVASWTSEGSCKTCCECAHMNLGACMLCVCWVDTQKQLLGCLLVYSYLLKNVADFS